MRRQYLDTLDSIREHWQYPRYSEKLSITFTGSEFRRTSLVVPANAKSLHAVISKSHCSQTAYTMVDSSVVSRDVGQQ